MKRIKHIASWSSSDFQTLINDFIISEIMVFEIDYRVTSVNNQALYSCLITYS